MIRGVRVYGPTVTPTPWGPAQTVATIAEGITSVTTASHGGILLSEERQAAMPAHLAGRNIYGGGRWYEEDCEWSLVAVAFPEAFPDEQDEARATLRAYFPEAARGDAQ